MKAFLLIALVFTLAIISNCQTSSNKDLAEQLTKKANELKIKKDFIFIGWDRFENALYIATKPVSKRQSGFLSVLTTMSVDITTLITQFVRSEDGSSEYIISFSSYRSGGWKFDDNSRMVIAYGDERVELLPSKRKNKATQSSSTQTAEFTISREDLEAIASSKDAAVKIGDTAEKLSQKTLDRMKSLLLITKDLK